MSHALLFSIPERIHIDYKPSVLALPNAYRTNSHSNKYPLWIFAAINLTSLLEMYIPIEVHGSWSFPGECLLGVLTGNLSEVAPSLPVLGNVTIDHAKISLWWLYGAAIASLPFPPLPLCPLRKRPAPYFNVLGENCRRIKYGSHLYFCFYMP